MYTRRFIIARRCVTSLVLGAMLTVLSAWACARLSPVPFTQTEHLPNSTGEGAPFAISAMVPSDWQLGCRMWSQSTGMRYQFITESVWMGSTLGALDSRRNRSMEWVELGWPVRCMQWMGTMDDRYPPRNGAFGTARHRIADGILIGGKFPMVMRYDERRLPLMPLWPGCAVSIMLYATVSFGALTALAALQRSRRRARGVCALCAYPASDSVVCSECGTPRA